MNRRNFLGAAVAFSGAVALMPSVALGSDRLFIDRWDNSGPWPGLKVRCLDLVTGYQVGLVYYLEHPGDMVVRDMVSICVLDARQHGRHIPEIGLRDCRPEYRERIAETLKRQRVRCMEDILAGHGFSREAREEVFASGLPQHGLLVREKVNVQVVGPADLLEKYRAEIPSGWELVPSVPTDVAAVLATDTGFNSNPEKETDILNRYFYRKQSQVEIAEAWLNNQPTVCYRIKRGLSRLSESQKLRVMNGWA